MRSVFFQLFVLYGVGFSLAGLVSYHRDAGTHPASEKKAPAAGVQPVEKAVHAPETPQVAPQAKPATRQQNVPIPREKLIRSENYFQEGYKQLMQERLAAAYRAFEKAAELAPIDARPHIGLARVLEALDYHYRAEEQYKTAIELEPDTPFANDARVYLSRILCDFGKNKESLEVLRAARKRNPDDPRIWAEMAANEIRLGNPVKAILLLQDYIREKGDQAWGLIHLGRAYADTGELEKAETAYRKGLSSDPYNELGLLWLGQLLVKQGKRGEAERHLKRFRTLRKLQTEERELEQHIARRPDNRRVLVMLYVRLAHVRELQGKTGRSLIPLEKAFELAPDDERLHQLYQRQKAKAGRRK